MSMNVVSSNRGNSSDRHGSLKKVVGTIVGSTAVGAIGGYCVDKIDLIGSRESAPKLLKSITNYLEEHHDMFYKQMMNEGFYFTKLGTKIGLGISATGLAIYGLAKLIKSSNKNPEK